MNAGDVKKTCDCKPDSIVIASHMDAVSHAHLSRDQLKKELACTRYAEQVLIVTSGEKMALYAANNICQAVRNFEDRGYASVRGLILNKRNVPGEDEKVSEFAKDHNVDIVAVIPRSDDITLCEDKGMTVVEGAGDSEAAQKFTDLAKLLLEG